MRIFGPSKLGNVLIVIGALLLLYVPASYGWTELQSLSLRNQLANEPPPTPGAGASLGLGAATSPAILPASPGSPTSPARRSATATTAPTATPHAALQSRSATVAPPTATETPLPTATLQPTATDTPQPTATPPPAPLGPPVRVVFSDLRIDTSVTPMSWTDVKQANGSIDSEWAVPENTAGWAVSSAQLGVAGNVVLSGHNNIYGMVFRPISMAWPENRKQEVNAATYSSDILNGRLIQLYAANGQRFDYRVTGFYRLHDSGVPLEQRQENASYMQQTPDPELTLITCWPPWSNTHRLVVRAALVQQ